MSPETWRRTTELVVICTVTLAILYNIAARIWGGNDATISAVVLDCAHKWPIIPAAVGLLVGHWFWPVRN